MFTYNCTRHSVTGYSPFYLMFGRKARLPIDVILDQYRDSKIEYQNTNEYINQQKEWMNEAFKIALKNTKKRRENDKNIKDIKATLKPLEIGSRVLVRNLGILVQGILVQLGILVQGS